MRQKHCLFWNMGRKLKNEENETKTLQDFEYCEKSDQRENRETHIGRTLNMTRNSEIREK